MSVTRHISVTPRATAFPQIDRQDLLKLKELASSLEDKRMNNTMNIIAKWHPHKS